MFVKIFECNTRKDLEKTMRTWLTEPDYKDIVSISYSHRRGSYSALIVYNNVPCV